MTQLSARDAVRPFRFACHRCGHCCTGGTGHVWVEEAEIPALALARGMSERAFAEHFLRLVRDPRTGAARLSLREREREGGGGGACALLEGLNHCSVYEARPRHCAEFPFWRSVLSDPAAFEAARATCPGIAVEPEPEVRARAFERLAALYAEVDAFVARSGSVCILRGQCCRFEEAGHELFASALEADYALARHPEPPAPEAPGRCPFHVRGRCTAREGRPLACRTYFCDRRTSEVLAEAHEHFLARLRAIERECAYPRAYARFPGLLEARGSRSLAQGEG